MLADQLYAIVDIEATGGSVGADERIIQIACVLMKNNRVIDRFNSLVNPGKKIPKKIQKLTNISNNDVKDAPYFEEIAPIIKRLLKDTIFVAHNVGFDYRFLNEQLAFHGFEEIAIAAIDTVELSQILYPTLDSFQLEEIASSLNYNLTDAHDALADAEATAYIFKKLFDRAQSLPLITLEKLVDLSECTTHETALLFIEALTEAKKTPTDLDDDLVIVNQIALKKVHTYRKEEFTLSNQAMYPRSKEEKIKYLKDNQRYRDTQSKMMDIIYDYFQSDLKIEKSVIEAPPGIGKTLAYLFPSSFIAKEEKPVIISTYTTILQDQLVEVAIPQLEKMLGRKIKVALLKSSRHYLSLSVFERWLKNITSKDSEAYLSMRLLVWLTDTQTGDLSEINAGSHLDLKFWQDIRARKTQYADERWNDYDFYERIKTNCKNAEIIVTNHHFLVNDWKSNYQILTDLEYLIIDEAHHFPDIATTASTISIQSNELFKVLDKMGSLSNNIGIFKFLNDLYQIKKVTVNDLKILNRTFISMKENWDIFIQDLINDFSEKNLFSRTDSNFVEKEYSLDILTLQEKRKIKNILRALEEFLYMSQDITIKSEKIFKDLNNENQLYLIELVNLVNYLKKWQKKIKKLFNEKQEALRWVSFLPEKIETTFQFNFLALGNENSFIDYIATHSKVVFTSSTLSYQNTEDYFSGQLKNLPMQYHQLESPFDYSEQVRVIVPQNSIHPKKIKNKNYAKLIANRVNEVIKGTELNSIILFRSLSLLEDVYNLLIKKRTLKKHLILAQGISGTRSRVLKQFKRKQPAIILGADSFFEGIDLPEKELELLILTRLPFPAPNTPLTKLKTSLLKEQSINPFIGEYLPRAVLKFRQAFGRLIRSKEDQGVMVILDERFLSANYSAAFKNALPKGVKFEILDRKIISSELNNFIDKEKEMED